MTKSELVKSLAGNAGITNAQAESVLNDLAAQAHEAVSAGGEFSLPEIGKLKVAETAARTGRNPKTGESIEVPAGRRVKFRPSKSLKEAAA